ncbi:MAG: hypothetical protein JHC31_16065 [Sulfurihydrogenibium sp.]|jgi:hypothetical protein|nr:hypothetical protein [Sulfurihydrogenibium sp.]
MLNCVILKISEGDYYDFEFKYYGYLFPYIRLSFIKKFDNDTKKSFVFELLSDCRNRMYVVVEEDLLDKEIQNYDWGFKFNGYTTRVITKLRNAKFKLMNEEELKEYMGIIFE